VVPKILAKYYTTSTISTGEQQLSTQDPAQNTTFYTKEAQKEGIPPKREGEPAIRRA